MSTWRPIVTVCRFVHFNIGLNFKLSSVGQTSAGPRSPSFLEVAGSYSACWDAGFVALLLRCGAPALGHEKLLFSACSRGSAECVNLLLAGRVNVDPLRQPDSATPLFVACQSGHVDIVRELLGGGVK